MPRLPVLSWKVILKKLERAGYKVVRQKGSHMTLINKDRTKKSLTLPQHSIVGRGLLRKILRDANLDIEGFLNL